MSNPEIKITYISNDEVGAWKRPIRLKFNGKEVHVNLYWDEHDGYSTGTPMFIGDWSDAEKEEFSDWSYKYESQEQLDELTAFIETNKSLEEDN
jgi:hypothetical protein